MTTASPMDCLRTLGSAALRWSQWAFIVGLSTLGTGCRRSQEVHISQSLSDADFIDSSDVWAELSQEITTLHDLALIRALGFLIFVVIAVALSNLLISRFERAGRKLGPEQRGRVTAMSLTGRGLVLLLAIGVVLHQFSQRVPLLTFICGIVIATGVLLVVAFDLRRNLGGLALVVESRLKKGDRLMIGDVEGIVMRVGLLRIRLRRADGRSVYIPLSRLSQETISVSSPTRAIPVELTFSAADPYSQTVREKLRQRAALCPYRDPASQAVVYAPGHNERASGCASMHGAPTPPSWRRPTCGRAWSKSWKRSWARGAPPPGP